MATVEEYFELGEKAYDENRYMDAVENFAEAAKLGDVDAESFVALCLYLYACQVQNETITYQDPEALIKGQGSAVNMCYDVVKIAFDYLSKTSEDPETANLMGQLVAQSFGIIYYVAANGYGFGYKLIEEGYEFKDGYVIANTLFTNWEKFHEEYVSLWSPSFADYSVFGEDRREAKIRQDCREVLENAKDAAKILELLGRECDALMLRTRMALEMSDYSNGNRTYLLAAEWFYNKAISVARAAFIGEDGDDSLYKDWSEDHVQTNQKYAQMTSNYRKVIVGYKKEGKKPAIGAFYLEGEAPSVDDNEAYMAMEKADIEMADDIAGDIAKERFLSVVAQINYKRFVPMIIFAAIVGFFMGGLIPIYTTGGAFAKAFGTVWFIITMILTWIRSITVSAGIASGKSYKTFRLFMIVWTAFLCLHIATFIIGIVGFFILKSMARKYE